MTLSRRNALILAAGFGAMPIAARAAPTLAANAEADQTAALQAAIDIAARLGQPVVLPAGTIRTGPLTLRPGTQLIGTGRTVLAFTGGRALLTGKDAARLTLANLTLEGAWRPLASGGGLVALSGCADLVIDGVTVREAAGHGITVSGCSGRIQAVAIEKVADAGLFALDSRLTVSGCAIDTCGNNGILVWRSSPAEDGSQVTGNRISRVRADGGGTGQNGNGINVYRAGGVMVAGNTITDCAYSAVRGNAASNIAITGNTCARIGEVALYAEFGFEGALIANNIVDRAATGISVTNFNEGGRLAVVQGNLIRNLFRREHEPVDTRGHGIAVEADTVVNGNTIEGAPTAGILVGWGRYVRDVSVTGNLIRGSRSGVLISADPGGGSVLVQANLIAGASDGAIRAHDKGRVFGPDLAREPDTKGRVTISGNAVS